MENSSFKNMPQAPTLPNLPKYFPDLQGENCGRTPYAGWWQNKVLPWIQNQDPIRLTGMFFFGALTLIAGWYQNELWMWIQNQDPTQLGGMFLFGALTLPDGTKMNFCRGFKIKCRGFKIKTRFNLFICSFLELLH